MKFGVCAILKNENLYLREWVEHYINLGFDKIILYDNNDINGESPDVVIQDYINDNIVDVIDKRGMNGKDTGFMWNDGLQMQVYNECLESYKDTLDWIAFFDIDEFLELCDGKTIQKQFEFVDYSKFEVVCVFWKIYGDNNNLYYKNDPVQKRFPNPSNTQLNLYTLKSICKTNKNIKFLSPHAPNEALCCSTNKIPLYIKGLNCLFTQPFYDHMYLKHYYTKSLTEFLYKKLNWWTPDDKSKEADKIEFCKNSYIKYNGNWTEEHEKIYRKFYDKHIKKEAP